MFARMEDRFPLDVIYEIQCRMSQPSIRWLNLRVQYTTGIKVLAINLMLRFVLLSWPGGLDYPVPDVVV